MWFGKLPSGPKHQKTRIYHLASNWDGMCGPNMLLNSAQSAPEANFLSKIPKVPKLPQLGRISKIPKITKLPKRPSSKICFRSCRGRDFLKLSIIRGCENLRGTLCLSVSLPVSELTHKHSVVLEIYSVLFPSGTQRSKLKDGSRQNQA